MIGSISDLEKDIEAFKNNIAASNEMYDILKRILDSIKESESGIEDATKKYEEDIEALPEKLSSISEEEFVVVRKQLNAELNEIRDKLRDTIQEYIHSIEDNRNDINITSEKIISAYSDYTEKIYSLFDEYTKQMRGVEDKLLGIFNEGLKQSSDQQRKLLAESNESLYKNMLGAIEQHSESLKESSQYIFEQRKIIVSSANETNEAIKSGQKDAEEKYQNFISKMDNAYDEYTSKIYELFNAYASHMNDVQDKMMDIVHESILTSSENQIKLLEERNESLRKSILIIIGEHAQKLKESEKAIVEQQDSLRTCVADAKTAIATGQKNIDEKYNNFLVKLAEINLPSLKEKFDETNKQLKMQRIILYALVIVCIIIGIVNILR